MDAASMFSSANNLYVKEEYEEALKHYTCAVALEDCAEHRVCRAACYLRLGKFEETLEDAKEALALDPKSHMALHWRGIALFYMGEYGGAKLAFEQSLQVSPTARAPREVWIRKCDAELSGSTLPLGGVAAEATKAAPSAAPAASKAAPAPAAASAPSAAPKAATTVSEANELAGKAASSSLTISGRKPVKREWYQSSTHVFITLFAKGVQQSLCEVDFKETEMSLSFPLPNSSEETYSEDLELFAAVNPSACSCEVSAMKVEIKLSKKEVGLQWKFLEKQEVPAEMPDHQPDQPAYPTSNKAKRDWSQIDRDIEAELKNEKPEGDEALNKLFKEIYERADPETRRAMNKSFQTSGGTVLSTNWGEVARADYEGKDRPTPPEGQEWRSHSEK